jgi:2-polyprenyl-3-methyl-5-hydroxy-6-metoxy-1,4-benzoquinol methylase
MTLLSQEQLKAIYNEKYVERYRKKRGEGRLERLLHLIGFTKEDIVLDVGCGSGFILELIQGKVSRYVGIDFSDQFISEAALMHKDVPGATFLCEGSDAHMRKNPSVYSKILLMDFTEHLYDDQLVSVLGDCRTMLADGGIIFVHTPNRAYFLEILKARGMLRQTEGHVAVRDARQYHRLAEKAGLAVAETRYLNHYLPVMKPFHVLSFLPILGTFFRARLFAQLTRDGRSQT